MEYVGNNNYVHRNLRAANVYASQQQACKLSGFHLARHMKDGATYVSRQERIAARWTAPEAAVGGRFSVKSDVWSFGVLLVELISGGETPYEGKYFACFAVNWVSEWFYSESSITLNDIKIVWMMER